MKREFASLSAQEALHVAIFVEERNADIYREFAEMFAEFRDPPSLEIAAAGFRQPWYTAQRTLMVFAAPCPSTMRRYWVNS